MKKDINDTMSIEEIREAVDILEKNRIKPKWGFQWRWPFFFRGYTISQYIDRVTADATRRMDEMIREVLEEQR